MNQRCKRADKFRPEPGPNPKLEAQTGPEPENKFEAQIMPEKSESQVRSKKFSNIAKLF